MAWLGISLFAGVVTVLNLVDSIDAFRVRGAGKARLVLAWANVRRETIRLVIALALVIVVLPVVGRPGDVPLTPGVALLMLVPVGVALNSYLDRRTRNTLARLVRADRS